MRHRWTDEERAFLVAHAETWTNRDLAKRFAVTERAVEGQLTLLRVRRTATARGLLNGWKGSGHFEEFAAKFWRKVVRAGPDDCWLWKGKPSAKGYGRIGRNRHELTAHRVAWELTQGRAPKDGGFICHTCDVPLCVNPAHLYEGDATTNNRDTVMRRRVRPRRGAEHPHAKLDEAAVLVIRATDFTRRGAFTELKRRYGVSSATIAHVRANKVWRHVKAA